MRRVVVTGLGMVTPLGCGVEATWANILAGKSGVQRITDFEVDDLACKIAARIPRGDDATRLWDAVETMATTSGMAELKRSLRARPQFD